jgi:hypothetical protein
MAVHRFVCLASGAADVLADRPDVEHCSDESSLVAANAAPILDVMLLRDSISPACFAESMVAGVLLQSRQGTSANCATPFVWLWC